VVKISAEQEREECEEPSAEQGEECEESSALPMRSNWIIDNDIPIFKGEGRAYIEKLVMVGE
jgi:hypothetical protein